MKLLLSQLQNEILSSIEHLGEDEEESKMKREWIEKLDFDNYIQDILNSSPIDTKHEEKEEDLFDSSSSFDWEWKRFAENNRQEMVASSSSFSSNNDTKIEKEIKEENQNEMEKEENKEEEERDMENEIELWGVPSFKFFFPLF